MALIKCKGCGHMISDKAIRCPKCGNLIKHNDNHLLSKIVIGILVILIIVSGLWLLAKSKDIDREKIKAAMPIVENFISYYYSTDFQGVRNKHIEWTPTDKAIEALTEKGYQVENIAKKDVEGEGGEYETITTTTLFYTNKEDGYDIPYYKVIIEDGPCGGITIKFKNEELKNEFVMEAKHYGFVQNSHNLVNGNDDDLLVWTLKGEDGRLWMEDGGIGDLTISISEKSIRINCGGL